MELNEIQMNGVFLAVAHPSTSIFKAPADLGLYATRNFYVKHRDKVDETNVTLGVWHILPNYIAKKFSNELGLSQVYIDSINTNVILFNIIESLTSYDRFLKCIYHPTERTRKCKSIKASPKL